MRCVLGLCLLFASIIAVPARAQDPSPQAWAYAAEPAFDLGTHGAAFFILGENQGCFDDNGTWACAVFAEGRRYLAYEGALTPNNILDILAVLPLGTLVELNGDIVDDSPDLAIVMFAQALPVKE